MSNHRVENPKVEAFLNSFLPFVRKGHQAEVNREVDKICDEAKRRIALESPFQSDRTEYVVTEASEQLSSLRAHGEMQLLERIVAIRDAAYALVDELETDAVSAYLAEIGECDHNGARFIKQDGREGMKCVTCGDICWNEDPADKICTHENRQTVFHVNPNENTVTCRACGEPLMEGPSGWEVFEA